MSLVECSECNWQISDTAYFCPKCGYIRKKIYLENPAKLYYIFSFLCSIVGSVFGFMYFTQKLSFDIRTIYLDVLIVCTLLTPASIVIGFIISKWDLKSE